MVNDRARQKFVSMMIMVFVDFLVFTRRLIFFLAACILCDGETLRDSVMRLNCMPERKIEINLCCLMSVARLHWAVLCECSNTPGNDINAETR